MPIEKVNALFGVKAPDTATIETKTAKPYDKNYFFHEIVLKKLILWMDKDTPNRNVFIPGDGGTGKTSLFVEFGARMGEDVYAKSCSGRTRFADLVGSLIIAEDGTTKFVDGPLTKAYRNGGIFLANEITRMDAGEQMLLVDVLDKRSYLTIAETGEMIYPHDNFRFAATGNSVGFGDESGGYAGEKRSSNAFLDRFWKIVLPELTEEQEIEVCKRYAPSLTDDIVKGMTKLARETRKQFIGNGGSLRICIQTRALFSWAMLSEHYALMRGIDPLLESLNDSVLNAAPGLERQAISEIYTAWINGK